MLSALAANGIWTDTVGLLFTYFVLVPALVTGLIVVAMVTAKGEKKSDDELRARWAARMRATRSDD
ncbi:MAG: hypothetical protein ACRDMZ_03855 [Solirubrobacteraceae bacterium]